MDDESSEVFELIEGLNKENLPSSIKEKCLSITTLFNEDCPNEVKISKVTLCVQEFSELIEKPSLDPYIRANMLSLISSLESFINNLKRKYV